MYTVIRMKRIRFANVTTVWNWSYKPIYMFVFKKDLSCNMFHFNDSINTWNSCAQFLKKEIIMKCLAINIFAWNFLTNANSKNIIAILRIVTTEKSELTFLNSVQIHHETEHNMKLSDGKMFRKSHPEKLCQKNNLKNFEKFTVKHVSESHFYWSYRPEADWCFPVNFAKFLRTHFFTEYLWWLLL